MNANEWREECVYISSVADAKGNVPEMNHDKETAARYMRMQRDAATSEGFHDSATHIGECLEDMGTEKWTAEDNAQSSPEGWSVFDCEDRQEIQREDELAIFASDFEAIAHVRERAAAGSALHVKALRIAHNGEMKA